MNQVFTQHWQSFQTGAQLITGILSNFESYYHSKSEQRELEEFVALFEICKSEVQTLLAKLDGPALDEKESEAFIADMMTYLDMATELETKITNIIKTRGA